MAMLTLLLSSACRPGQVTPATELPTVRPTATPDQTTVRLAWQDGPHADTYDLEKGPNTYCARCHSPANWDPTATIDASPNCVSCKFPFESEPRVAKGNPFVPQEEWAGIGCNVCHRPENGWVEPAIAWLDSATTYYETVADSTALCQKCHLDSETLSHQRHLGDGAHADFRCIDCHDTHDMGTTCSSCHQVDMAETPKFIPEHEDVTGTDACDECHNGKWEAHDMDIQQAGDDNCMGCHGRLMGLATIAPIQYGHSALHYSVNCVACHDATGMEVGPVEGQDVWMTYRTTELMGRVSTKPYQSHDIQGLVSCDRCHYPFNPWDLALIEEETSGDGADD